MSEGRLTPICQRVMEAGWLAAIIVVPVFFNMYSRRGFDADKIALFRALATIMAAAWLIKWLDHTPFKRPQRWSSATVLMFALIVAYALITLTSIAPQISLLGSYTRLQGTYTLITGAVFFGLIAQELRTRAQLNRLIAVLILAGSAVALYGLIQYAGLDPLWASTQFGERISATIGNPIYLAAYLLMTSFATVGQVAANWPRRRWASGLYAGLAALQLLAFLATGSRGPFIGGLAGIFFLVLVTAAIYRRSRLMAGTVGAGLLVAAFLVLINLPNSPLASVRGLPGIGRFFNLTATTGDSGRARLLIWGGSASLVQPHAPIQFPDGTPDPLNAARLLVGYGPETMYLVFQQYFPPKLTTETGYSGDTFVNRSHNETWDALITGGVIGLVIYQVVMLFVVAAGLRGLGLVTTAEDRRWLIGLWVITGLISGLAASALLDLSYFGLGLPIGTLIGLMLYLWRCARSSIVVATTPDRAVLAAVLAAAIAHYVEIQWGIAVIASTVIFWSLAALSVALSRAEPLEVEPPASSAIGRAASYGLFAALINTLLLYAFVTNFEQIANPVLILWRSLTYNSLQKTDSAVILWLVLVISAIAALLFQLELAPWRARQRAGATLLMACLAIGLTAGFGLLFAAQPGFQQQTAQLSDLLQYARTRLDLFDLLVVYAIGLSGLLAVALLADRPVVLMTAERRSKIWAAIALLPIGLAAAWWADTSNLDVIRADMVYKQGQSMESFSNWDYAIGLYQQAIAYTPYEDTYYRGLGQAFIDKAASLEGTTPHRLDTDIPAATILTMNWQALAQLNRVDSLYAAIAVFNQARQINPLNADHTAGLALAYQRLADNVTGTNEHDQLAAAARQFYATALRLRPQDTQLQAAQPTP